MREELERRAQEIKGKLKPWRGLTIREAREKGWGEQEDRLQIEPDLYFRPQPISKVCPEVLERLF